jgi:hypothetical protein
MNILAVRLLVGVIALGSATVASAGLISGRRVEMNFTKADVVKQASWQSTGVKLGADGLEYEGNQIEPFELQTTQPLAIGVYWWPAESASVLAILTTTLTSPGTLFVRFSPDAEHWSTWQALARRSAEPNGYTFSGEIAVPRQRFQQYADLCREFDKQQPGKPRDGAACARWILTSQPDFFDKEPPFIGYVQFLYETEFRKGQRLQHLDIDVDYGVPSDRGISDVPWSFRTQ